MQLNNEMAGEGLPEEPTGSSSSSSIVNRHSNETMTLTRKYQRERTAKQAYIRLVTLAFICAGYKYSYLLTYLLTYL